MKINNQKKNNKPLLKINNHLIFLINFILIFSAFFVVFNPVDLIFFQDTEKNFEHYKNEKKNEEKEYVEKNSIEKNSVEKNDFIKNDEDISEIKNLISYKIDKVLDGDTVKIFYENGKKISIRMIGIDTPESFKTRYGYAECFGKEASNYLKNLVGDSENVFVEIDKTQGKFDKYGRLLAYVFLKNGEGVLENLNGKMLKDGYAWEYTYSKKYKYQTEFKNFEISAKNSGIGLRNKNTCNGKRVKLED